MVEEKQKCLVSFFEQFTSTRERSLRFQFTVHIFLVTAAVLTIVKVIRLLAGQY